METVCKKCGKPVECGLVYDNNLYHGMCIYNASIPMNIVKVIEFEHIKAVHSMIMSKSKLYYN